MKIRQLAYSALSASILLCTSQSVQAAGFYIQEQSVKGLGYAFSGSTTSIDDASTIYFNPAGMTKLDGAQVNAGVHLLIPHADLTDTGTTVPFGAAVGNDDGGNPYDPTPVPNLYAAAPFDFQGRQIWAGIGVSAPFGLGSDYGDNWFGRFDSTETELMTINIQPSLAIQATDWLSIGGGVDIQYADAELKAVANPGTGEGISTLKGDDWSLGYNLGVMIEPTEKTDVGIHYRSAIDHELDGRITFVNGTASDSDVGGGADLNLPDLATFGVAHDITPQTRIMGQATWFGWSTFDRIRAVSDAGAELQNIEQDYQDTWAFAIGVEHDLNEDWTVRAGYQFDETPTTDEFRTSRTPDGDRNWFSGGATYKWNDKIELDFAATYIDVDDGTINVNRNAAAPAIARSDVSANTDGYVGIVAVGLNYKF
jgi:long-chain fatty acid transport protein